MAWDPTARLSILLFKIATWRFRGFDNFLVDFLKSSNEDNIPVIENGNKRTHIPKPLLNDDYRLHLIHIDYVQGQCIVRSTSFDHLFFHVNFFRRLREDETIWSAASAVAGSLVGNESLLILFIRPDYCEKMAAMQLVHERQPLAPGRRRER